MCSPRARLSSVATFSFLAAPLSFPAAPFLTWLTTLTASIRLPAPLSSHATLSEAVILSTGMPIPAQWTCPRRCRDRANMCQSHVIIADETRGRGRTGDTCLRENCDATCPCTCLHASACARPHTRLARTPFYKRLYTRHLHPDVDDADVCDVRIALYRLYLGIADGMSIARVWACRYSE